MLTQAYIEINETIYHYQHKIVNPNAPTLVFLHDSLGSVELWRDFPEQLGDKLDYNIFVYDREGHGLSSAFTITKRPTNYLELGADRLHELLTQLNIKNVILFGHSDGATISLWYAAKYPENVKATIVEGVHVFVEEETLNGIKAAKEALKSTNLAERVARYHGDKTEMLFKLWMDTWLDDSYRDWNIEKDIQSIVSPVLVLQGENDEFGTMEQVNKIEQNIHGPFQSYLIENCGHNPHKEQTQFTIEKTKEFILTNT